MHHPIIIILLLLIVFLVLPRGRCQRKSRYLEADKPLSPGFSPPAQNEPQVAPEQTDESLCQGEEEQLRQALALGAEVKKLEREFAAIQARLPVPPQDGQAEARGVARRQQVIIITEQLRIARSYSGELLRFVTAGYQAPGSGQHTPSCSDASWAFTAARLTLTFARARIIALA